MLIVLWIFLWSCPRYFVYLIYLAAENKLSLFAFFSLYRLLILIITFVYF